MTALDQKLSGTASLAGTFLFLTTATTALRFLARYKQKAYVGPDDYAALGSWVGYVGMAALFIYGMTHHFIGYHKPSDPAVQKAQHPMMEQVFLSLNILEVWAFGTVKVSALFFYRRVFVTKASRNTIFNCLTIILIAIVAAWIVTFSILTFEICAPHNTIEYTVVLGITAQCKLNYPYFQGVSISDFALDVIIIGLAFPMIWSLSMSRARKTAVSGVFLLALGGVGASCARMVAYVDSVHAGRAANDKDEYRVNTQRQYYALLEGGLGLVSVNLPSIWYFVADVTPGHVLHGIRSLASLHSLGSVGSKHTATTHDATTRNDGSSVEALDIEGGRREVEKAPDKIHVQHSVEVTSLRKDSTRP